MSDDMQTSLRFYQERCTKFGVPKGFGHQNGFSRIDTTMPSYWSGRRPNWRFNADQKETGDPDSPFTTQELMAQYAIRFMDGHVDDYEDY